MPAQTVAVVACDQFSAFHLSVPSIVFDAGTPGPKLFNVILCAAETGPVRSREGLLLDAPADLEALDSADIIVIPYWPDPAKRPSDKLLDALRRAHQRGTRLAGLCLGTYVLAYAGLLDNKKASTHWEFENDFRSRFPTVHLDENALYVEDGTIITSAGTAAGVDCCLHLVRTIHGSATANRIARRLVMPPHREGGQAQYIERPLPENTGDERINRLMQQMRDDLSARHSLDQLAEQVMMSRRTFTRAFHKATGMPVNEWLVRERLRQALELLESTHLSIEQVAEQAGFPSPLSFRTHFRKEMGVTPRDWRRTFCGE